MSKISCPNVIKTPPSSSESQLFFFFEKHVTQGTLSLRLPHPWGNPPFTIPILPSPWLARGSNPGASQWHVHKCNSPICRFKLFPLISSIWNTWHWPVHNAHLSLMLASSNVTCFYIQGAVYSTREKDKTTSDVTDAMLLVKNKSIALLWELNSIFM